MFQKRFDIVAIGDITTDAFIRLKEASIHCKVKRESCEICLPFGGKVPFEYVKVIKAVGNAANVSVAAEHLGLKSALISNIGNDQNGKDCLVELRKNHIDTSLIKTHHNKATNYHFVLWYENDRTILTNHIEYDYHLPKIPETKWIYLTSLATDASVYYIAIANHLATNRETKLAFQPGTFQIRLGNEKLKRIYERADVLLVNKNEAEKILGINTEIGSRRDGVGPHNTKEMLKSLAKMGPKLIVITDNTNGAYMYDGDHSYHMPMYPDPRIAFERTGCGDAFSATFVSALSMGKTPLEALLLAPVNPMSVAQFVGSQEGLLTLKDIEWWLKQAPPEYRPREI